jgi:prepilin-type N-terminal cleavage/methylation domain-containing protein
MKTLNYKKAFTLVELLTVVLIIGMIASVALITVRDTGEVRAKEYTKKVIRAVKNGIAKKEDGRVFTGFLNDFGTMPPNIHFLLGNDSNETNFVGLANGEKKLGKFRITSDILFDNNSSDTNISMPFLNRGTTPNFYDSRLDNDNISKDSFNISAMYIGFHGGYIGEGIDNDKSSSIKDGWNKVLDLSAELNISIDGGENFLVIYSAGSDGIFQSSGEVSLLKPEFDEYNSTNSDSIKALYSEDYTLTYRKEVFIPRNMQINLELTRSGVDETKILIYSPMLYYADNSVGLVCREGNTTHAFCPDNATARKYVPYLPYVNSTTNDYENAIDSNLSWQIGIIKYEFHFDYNNSTNKVSNGELYINNELYPPTNHYNGDIDFTTDFYISSGEKQIVIFDNNGSGWEFVNSYSEIFMPDETIKIHE